MKPFALASLGLSLVMELAKSHNAGRDPLFIAGQGPRNHEGREAFVQPGIAPVFARDQVAEPLMAQLVRVEAIHREKAVSGLRQAVLTQGG